MEEQIRKESWFKRNWKWVVPLGGCLTLIILFFVFIGSIFFGVTSMLKESTPYTDAFTALNTNVQVEEVIGHPVETNGLMQGNLSLNNNDGTVNLRQPVKGPKGEAVLIVVGEKTDGEWSYETMHLLIEGTDEKIDLLEDR
ncbi:hypothetical protein GWK08_13740 [Leptobacterium flavescens]|uniref:Cytochrome oxidase complex assembly protein 1 n=1 Tax=Leptobacterium flavescens TaxID=472055 RepID=A0A6P0UMD5_9FLAO|nr:cytochrome c oxidase assembly factor Coa1 family protein [Leptobacterium flavescens]NER14511.1 hypothetical protein [Leptobacterium flavescens]